MVLPRNRAYFVIGVDIDPVPGSCDSSEDWEGYWVARLSRDFPWYHPTVTPVAKQTGQGYPLRYEALRPTTDAFRTETTPELYNEEAELDRAWCDNCGWHHSGNCK